MKNVKRLLSIVLALAMLLTMASFPALAANYTYEPKTVVLEGSKTWWENYGGQRGIIRPTNDFYVGDKLSFGDGVTMGVKPTVTVSGVAYDIVALRFDYDYKYGPAGYLGKQKYVGVETIDGVTYLTGFYNTADEAAKKTGSKNPITLDAVGKIGAGFGAAYYYDSEGALQTEWIGAFDNTTGIEKSYLWFIDVKAAPTTKNYQAVAPEKLHGLANNTTALTVSDFVTDPTDTENFDSSKNNLYYLAQVDVDGATKEFYINPQAYTYAKFCSFNEGVRFEFVEKAYVKDVTINIEQGYLKYDVFGSLDNENWYPLTIGGESSGTDNHKIAVDGIVKYLRVDIRALPQVWGWLTEPNGIVLKSVNAYLNVPEAWTVTITDGKTTKTVTTDINGNFDYSDLTTKYPTDEFAYFVNGKEVTEAIANGTYRADSDVTINIAWNYPEKTVGLYDSINGEYYAGPMFLARPTNDFYIGDSLTIAADAKILKTVRGCTGMVSFKLIVVRPDGTTFAKYVKVDADGNYSGFYNDKNCTQFSNITFDQEGKWAIAVVDVYDSTGIDLLEGSYFSEWSIKSNLTVYRDTNQCGVHFFLDVKATPTSSDYKAEAPAKLSGLDALSTSITIDTSNLEKAWVSEANTIEGSNLTTVLKYGYKKEVRAYAESVNLAFDTNTYVKSFNFYNGNTRTVLYDVFGSINGTDWYAISLDNTTTTQNTTVKVGEVVKYLRVDIRDHATHWGRTEAGWAISSVVGVENVPEAWTVTFTDGTTTKEVTTDAKGFYTVPAEFKGDFNYYSDANYTTKLNTAIPAKGNITVYVKANTWTYTPKTVNFFIKNTPNGVKFGTYFNGPIVAPRDTIYVGDTIVLPHEEYKNLTSGISGAQEIVSLSCCIERYGSKEGDNGKSNDLGSMVDVKFTVTEPGVYNFRVSKYTYLDAEGNTVTGSGSVHGGTYNCVFVVLPAPTSAPKASSAPVYTGAAGSVVALLDTANGTNIADKNIAFKKSYGRNPAYASGGEGKSVLPINTKMDSPDDGILQHPTSQTLYLQFNLPSISYVDNIVVSGSEIYDYDTYGSTDGENWYLLNSGIVSKNTFKVKGVAKHLRIVVRATDGWGATISKYVVNGYVIDENTVDETPASAWVKADGTKTEITSTAALPVAYATSSKNYAVTGWKINTGNGFVKVSLADIAKMDVEDIGNLHAVVTEIPVAASALTATLEPKGTDEGKTFDASKYINGFYVEGAQIRVTSGEGEVKSGLRFINLLDNKLITKLNELKSERKVDSYEYGTLVVADTQYTGGDLVIGYTQKNGKTAKAVVGEKLFADAGDFDNAYFKYTVCVTNIDEANYATDVIVRPYITINNADGTSVTLYGEQYNASVYSAAKFALDNDPNLTAEETACLEGIVNVVEG